PTQFNQQLDGQFGGLLVQARPGVAVHAPLRKAVGHLAIHDPFGQSLGSGWSRVGYDAVNPPRVGFQVARPGECLARGVRRHRPFSRAREVNKQGWAWDETSILGRVRFERGMLFAGPDAWLQPRPPVIEQALCLLIETQERTLFVGFRT